MTAINRRGFIAAGFGAACALPALAALSDPKSPIARRSRIDVKASLEDNLINEYLQPTPLSLSVGASKPFAALHFSDTHVCMMDAADILAGKSRELSLYEARNHGAFGHGGFPFAVPSLAATIAYARRKNLPLLNTGDLFDFRSEANIAAIAHSFKGVDVFSSLGNHEGHGLHSPGQNPKTAAAEDALRQRYEAAIGNPLVVASRVINGVNFVAFDNCEMSRFVRGKMVAQIEAEFAKGLPTVLMCHMPPYSPALQEAVAAKARARNSPYVPKAGGYNSYYMLGQDVETSRAPAAFRRLFAFLRRQTNLKAILCGHLHFEWQGTFGDGVPVVVAGRNFNGECYEISFT